MVAGALTWLAVAAVSGRGGVGMETAYVVVFAGEGDVDVLRGSPAITMKQPCDAPTENAAWSAVCWRIVHLAAAAIVDRTRLMLDVVDADGDVIEVAPDSRR